MIEVRYTGVYRGIDFAEAFNSIRRIYTDGREHTPEVEAYALWNGDSIGFWEGDSMVIHTTQLMSGQYQRSQPDYTDQVETVNGGARLTIT